MRRLLAALAVAAAALAPALPARAQTTAATLPPIRHVFVINLENTGFSTTFAPGSPARYLTSVLRPQGMLLTQYYGIGHNSLPNYVAEISGQGPNPDTQGDCQIYTDDLGTGTLPPGQQVGQGCVYPSSVETVADQLDTKGFSWKGYMEDMGNSVTESHTCRHPALNTRDDTQSAKVGDQYAARHDPFVYFHAITDSPRCSARVVPLDVLPNDLASADQTPNLSFITPNLCDDGHDTPTCVDGRTGGLPAADAWLQTWVPKILASPAYQQDGLLIVTFDEAGLSDTSSCCGEGPGPNSPLPGIGGIGGGQIGAVLVSQFIRPGGWNDTPYNHYSMLCSIESLFGLPRLGYAGQAGLRCFGNDVYTNGIFHWGG